jgi:hypothetical protein
MRAGHAPLDQFRPMHDGRHAHSAWGDGRVSAATLVVPLFWAFNLALIAVGMARLVPLTFPVLAVAVGGFLFLRAPGRFLAFLWWLWFLTPAVRRLVDYDTGWTPVSVIMPTPYLVALIPAATLMGRLHVLSPPQLLSLGLIVSGIGYAYVVGLGTAGIAAATFGLLTWLVPVLFGFHLMAAWRNYPSWRRTIRSVFRDGAVILSVYALIQFVFVPPWDAAWMVNSEMTSIGWPEPFRVRVFSTLNAPGVLAMVLMAALLLGLAGQSLLQRVASIPVWLVILLTQVRSAWLGLGVGLILFLAGQPWARSLKLVGGALLLVLALLPVLQIDVIEQVAVPRLLSISDLQSDNSLNERLELYSEFLSIAAGNVSGAGIGATNLATRLSNDGSLSTLGVIDSGLLEIMFVFGWAGTVLYGSGVALALVLAVLGRQASSGDCFLSAAGGIVAGCLIQLVFFNPLGGAVGMIFWCFLGLVLAGQRANRHAEHGWS